jgi:tetratricopeptide (TPR) repeat protein
MGKRYRKLEDLGDLEVALQNFQEAAYLSPKGHSERATYLRNISFTYKVRYEKLGDLQDLEDAIENLQKFIDLTPEELPERAGQLTKLASWRSLAQVKRIRNLSSFGVS